MSNSSNETSNVYGKSGSSNEKVEGVPRRLECIPVCPRYTPDVKWSISPRSVQALHIALPTRRLTVSGQPKIDDTRNRYPLYKQWRHECRRVISGQCDSLRIRIDLLSKDRGSCPQATIAFHRVPARWLSGSHAIGQNSVWHKPRRFHHRDLKQYRRCHAWEVV